MSTLYRDLLLRAGLFGLASVSMFACAADAPPPAGDTSQVHQDVINPPLPPNLNLALNAKTSLTIGPFTEVLGDVASSTATGSILFDVSSNQGFFSGFNALAMTINVRTGATAGNLTGNVLNVDGSATSERLGLDPATLPQVPALAPATAGRTAVTLTANQQRQLCAGQYGALTLGQNAVLSLNGGVYQVSKISLADGARLEPSEPVVILVTGALTTTTGSSIGPSAQALNPMTAGNIRIEVGTTATFGNNNQITAHLLVPNGKLATGSNTVLSGAAWAKTIAIGDHGVIQAADVFSLQAPSVPPPCNDNNACTTDVCVTAGSAAFCTNTPVTAGTSCGDGNLCNGSETCDAAGTCQPGTPLADGASCADGNACNGDETCFFGTCEPGTPPPVDDGNACTNDSCDPAAGVSHLPVADGTTCNGIGTCEAGACDIPGALFSQDFFQFQEAPAQCEAWLDFTNNQLIASAYNSVTVSGSFDPIGTTCTDPAAATQICQALHQDSFASVSCNGHLWNVGPCGGTPEVNVDSSVCVCDVGSPFSTVRPCVNENWGGVKTDTCFAPSQNLTVVCQ